MRGRAAMSTMDTGIKPMDFPGEGGDKRGKTQGVRAPDAAGAAGKGKPAEAAGVAGKGGPAEAAGVAGKGKPAEAAIFSREAQQQVGGEEQKKRVDVSQMTLLGGPGPNIGQYVDLARQMGYSRDADGKETPLTDKETRKLALAMSSYEPDTIRKLQKEGVRFGLVGDETLGTSNGRYIANTKNIQLKKSQFEDKATNNDFMNGLVSARHEIGHAIDDMAEPDTDTEQGRVPNLKSEKDQKLKSFFDNYMNRAQKDPDARFDDYVLSKLTPTEYVAEGFQAYSFTSETREELKTKDRDLYDYIESMLKP